MFWDEVGLPRFARDVESKAETPLTNSRLSSSITSMPCSMPTPEPVSTVGKRMVQCVKFQREMPGLDEAPFDGPLGQRIFENVSLEAWKLWQEHCKMILNEYRLNPSQKEAQEIIVKHMEDFFF